MVMAAFDPFLRKALEEYEDPDTTRADVLNATNTFVDLRPTHEVFVFNDGISRMLLHLDGTIPITYKGNVYNIPILVCVLDTHPYNPPIVFVKPTSTMQIKSGRNVDQNGKIDIPYLRKWNTKSDLLELLQILVVIFGEEPPVCSRLQATNQITPPGYPDQRMPYPLAGGYPSYPSGSANYATYHDPTPITSNPETLLDQSSMSSDADQTTGSDSVTDDDELQELQTLKRLLKCKICKARHVRLAFLPCGHCIACEECGSKIQSCPMCPESGVNTRGTVKITFAL